MSLLHVEGLSAHYGASQALYDVNLTINPGDVLALMGRNGMGKSTTVKAICRMMPSTGELSIDGISLHPLASHQVARLGVGLVPEGRRCFAGLSVKENLTAAARPGAWTLGSVTQLFPRLGERLSQRASTLSGGEQQMLAIGRALMTNPRLLVLDEATEGLAPIIRQEIWSAINLLKRESELAILLIDKSVQELARVADHAAILARGRTVWSGPMNTLSANISEEHIGV